MSTLFYDVKTNKSFWDKSARRYGISVTRAHDKTPHFSHFATDVRHGRNSAALPRGRNVNHSSHLGEFYAVLSYLSASRIYIRSPVPLLVWRSWKIPRSLTQFGSFKLEELLREYTPSLTVKPPPSDSSHAHVHTFVFHTYRTSCAAYSCRHLSRIYAAYLRLIFSPNETFPFAIFEIAFSIECPDDHL